ncbi:Acyl-CoA dehydrogenase [Rhizobium sp. RU35A]|uniref:Flavin-dependent monooxygenase n=1 Tax=Rhizobium straminoryzae TaxID=1387186 RepID=A0A549SWK3_9HYPH|nr:MULTISPECIES: acyl-CoA dehydrogenase family protein [Rhizobium]TRL34016.1 flavin-dependent monooxygenase [Rhizobium straminoryzae]SIQ30295.1 Acyl-CoA dehydrogenase [Rhizobium sp. RU35A]
MNYHAPPASAGALDALKSEIRARAEEFQALRHIPKDIVRQFQAVGVYRAFVPKRFGGDELAPQDFCRLIEEIATADASAGWVASFGVSATYLASLPPETYAAIYGTDPNTVFAGAMFPPQPARRVAGGLEVSGRWPWGSGVMGADIVGAGIKIEGENSPLPRTAVLPRAKASVDENWDTVGLRATGSHDIVIDKAIVPEEWTFIRGGKPQQDDLIFRYPAMALAAQVLAVVALGAARSALDWVHANALARASVTGAPSPAARAYIQIDFAKAEGILMGARSAFYDAIEDGWRQMQTNGEVDRPTLIRLRHAASKAAQDGAEAARLAFVMGGSEAMATGHPLGRKMIDAACVAQHAFINSGSWQAAGAALFDQQTPPGYP